MRPHPNILWLAGECLVLLATGFTVGYLWPHASIEPLVVVQAPIGANLNAVPAEPASIDSIESSASQSTLSSEQPASDQKAFVASISSSKYHPILDCSYADRIKPENRIYFATESEAQAAGYTPSSCLTK